MSKISFYIDTACDDPSGFDSGYSVFNDYLHLRDDSSVMHYIIEPETDDLMAYFALLSSALLYGELSHLGAIPAIELKMFALDKRYQKKGVANTFIYAILEVIKHYSTEYVGAKIILLYSVPVAAVTKLYEDCGFRYAKGSYATYKSPFNEGCLPMYKLL